MAGAVASGTLGPKSRRSMPEQKPRPAPVSTTTRTPRSAAIARTGLLQLPDHDLVDGVQPLGTVELQHHRAGMRRVEVQRARHARSLAGVRGPSEGAPACARADAGSDVRHLLDRRIGRGPTAVVLDDQRPRRRRLEARERLEPREIRHVVPEGVDVDLSKLAGCGQRRRRTGCTRRYVPRIGVREEPPEVHTRIADRPDLPVDDGRDASIHREQVPETEVAVHHRGRECGAARRRAAQRRPLPSPARASDPRSRAAGTSGRSPRPVRRVARR